ncbi:MAG: helix-turn-helix domain-containing protein [Pseudomonadota bacterium]
MTFRDTNGDFLNGPGHNDENGLSLHDNVRRSVQRFLRKNRHAEPEDLYHILLEQVEKPLIAEVLRWTGGNQSRCAEVLGISRGKLRQRIQHYKL